MTFEKIGIMMKSHWSQPVEKVLEAIAKLSVGQVSADGARPGDSIGNFGVVLPKMGYCDLRRKALTRRRKL